MAKKQEMVVGAFIVKEGKILIARGAKTKSFLPDKFELLGGHIEFGETPEEALRRELLEEMHIDIQIKELFYAFTYITDKGETHCIEVDYFAEMSDPKQQILINPEDHSEYAWITEAQVSSYFDGNDQERKAVEEAFRILKSKNRN